MKTFNKKDVFCICNAEDAIQYINHECYFGDSFNGLQYCIDNNVRGLLKDVRDGYGNNVGCIFVADRLGSMCISSFGLCLPCELVKEEKYRAFKSVEITPDMVENKIGIFFSLEIKTEKDARQKNS